MENKVLLSIAIPTYNRAPRLEELLDSILSQMKEPKGEVEICVSDNDSTDNTAEVVAGFQEKYPGLINYNKNKKNLGADANIIKVIEMSRGEFVWTFGDDDSMADGGLKEAVEFIKKINRENIGLIVTRVESYFIDKQTGKKIIFVDTLDKNKPKIFKIDRKDIIGLSFPQIGFMSILIFNNELLKKLLAEDRAFIEQGIGTNHIQMVLFALMFLKYSYANGIVFNRKMVCQQFFQYKCKYFIEYKFMVHYQMQRKLNNLLLSCKYMNDDYAPLIFQRYKGLRWDVVVDMMAMKAFKSFNYLSYFGCLKLFFQHSTFIDMLLFSSVFSILFLVPPVILTSLYKGLLIIRHGKRWKAKWNLTNSLACLAFKGARRRN